MLVRDAFTTFTLVACGCRPTLRWRTLAEPASRGGSITGTFCFSSLGVRAGARLHCVRGRDSGLHIRAGARCVCTYSANM